MAAATAVDLAGLVHRARALVVDGRRVILGLAGLPGSGKSYLADRLATVLSGSPPDGASGADWVRCLPMDGFHLAESELHRQRRRHRKGAPDTFDGYGYAALLARVAADPDPSEIIYAPTFDRTMDESLAGSIAIPSSVRLIITEGNYLLLPEQPWARAHEHLDEVWFCDTDESRRMRQLVERHVGFGRSRADALEWARTSDQPNAICVAAQRHRADLFVPDSTMLEVSAVEGPGHGSPA